MIRSLAWPGVKLPETTSFSSFSSFNLTSGRDKSISSRFSLRCVQNHNFNWFCRLAFNWSFLIIVSLYSHNSFHSSSIPLPVWDEVRITFWEKSETWISNLLLLLRLLILLVVTKTSTSFARTSKRSNIRFWPYALLQQDFRRIWWLLPHRPIRQCLSWCLVIHLRSPVVSKESCSQPYSLRNALLDPHLNKIKCQKEYVYFRRLKWIKVFHRLTYGFDENDVEIGRFA